MTLAQVLRKLIARATAAAALFGILLAAAAFSPHESFTEADLLEELRERGLLFQLDHEGSDTLESFSRMNGFLTTNELRWTPYERLYVSHFSGRGEAAVAASRISIDGFASRYPDDTYTEWVTTSDNIGFPVNRYQRGSLIVTYAGRSAAIPEALDEIMGKPFAGDRALGDRLRLGEDFPLFQNLWREHQVKVDSVTTERVGFGEDGLDYRVNYRALLVHSSACSGGTESQREVTIDEIHFTLVQQLINLDEVELTEPCDLDWQWEERFFVAQGLTAGQGYKVFINDEQVTTFTAEG